MQKRERDSIQNVSFDSEAWFTVMDTPPDSLKMVLKKIVVYFVLYFGRKNGWNLKNLIIILILWQLYTLDCQLVAFNLIV